MIEKELWKDLKEEINFKFKILEEKTKLLYEIDKDIADIAELLNKPTENIIHSKNTIITNPGHQIYFNDDIISPYDAQDPFKVIISDVVLSSPVGIIRDYMKNEHTTHIDLQDKIKNLLDRIINNAPRKETLSSIDESLEMNMNNAEYNLKNTFSKLLYTEQVYMNKYCMMHKNSIDESLKILKEMKEVKLTLVLKDIIDLKNALNNYKFIINGEENICSFLVDYHMNPEDISKLKGKYITAYSNDKKTITAITTKEIYDK